MLTKPSLSDPQIAKSLGVSRGLGFRTRKSLLSTIEYELAQNVAGKFLTEFQMASDYFKLQIERLEDLKLQKNRVLLKDGSVIEMEISTMEVLAIEKQQTELWKNIELIPKPSNIS